MAPWIRNVPERFHFSDPFLTDGDLFSLALNVEYLLAEFYSVACFGRSLGESDTGGPGTSGKTEGGRRVEFKNPDLAKLAQEFAREELAHLRLIRNAMGSTAWAKPPLRLDALGMGFGSDAEFIMLSRVLEDFTVSTYRGAAKWVKSESYTDILAGLIATEGYHAGHVRSHAIYAGIHASPGDPDDQPPSPSRWVPVDGNGLALPKTPAEAVTFLRGSSDTGGRFFPQGLNGKIR